MKLFSRTRFTKVKTKYEKDSHVDNNTVADRLHECLSDNSFKNIMNYENYIDPTHWMKEHIKKHPEYLASQSGTVAILPYTFVLSETGICFTGRCTCDICGEKFNMTNIDML